MILGQERWAKENPLEDAGYSQSGKGHWTWLGVNNETGEEESKREGEKVLEPY